ncbi:hypothetical protein C8F01DRAFT_1181291 [Mycena amicta]|nr:hypothetical protein C8F01DRAFT_1181291 [Mycena amicta]
MHSTVLIVALVVSAVAFDPGRGNTILAGDAAHADPQSKLSPCVEECVVSAAKDSPCGTPERRKNLECECTNKAFQTAAFICMHSKCTSAELVEALEAGQQECAKFGLGGACHPLRFGLAATTHPDTNTIRIGSSPAGHIHASNFLEPSTTKSQAEPTSTQANGKPESSESAQHISTSSVILPSSETAFTETQTTKLTSTASVPIVSVAETSTDSAHTSSDASVTSESASAIATVGGSSSSAASPRDASVSWPVAVAILAIGAGVPVLFL